MAIESPGWRSLWRNACHQWAKSPEVVELDLQSDRNLTSDPTHRTHPADAVERLTAALADRYRIERELGAGGILTVDLAEDPKHQRTVAVKVLRADLAAPLGPRALLCPE